MDLSKSKNDEPVQPVIKYPPSMFGTTKWSFQSRWYEQFPWLEYSVSLDAAFCFACRFFITSSPDLTFTSVGFKDWKHATGQKVGLGDFGSIIITIDTHKYHDISRYFTILLILS